MSPKPQGLQLKAFNLMIKFSEASRSVDNEISGAERYEGQPAAAAAAAAANTATAPHVTRRFWVWPLQATFLALDNAFFQLLLLLFASFSLHLLVHVSPIPQLTMPMSMSVLCHIQIAVIGVGR